MNSIKDKFTQNIATNSVRTFGVFETYPLIANRPTVCVSCWWLCYEPVAVRTTRETLGGPWIEVLQAGHTYVRTSRYEGTGSNPSDLQQQSHCGWGSFVRLDHFVTARIARITFGASCSRSYEPSDPEHVKRNRKSYISKPWKVRYSLAALAIGALPR